MRLVLGSRASRLALWQAEHVASLLRAAHGERVDVEVRTFSTRGDEIRDVPLPEIGGKGLFTAELEEALLAGEIDAAVHSLKDLPTELPVGLQVSAVPRRADPRDALVLPAGSAAPSSKRSGLDSLPPRAVVGTSSTRRAAQVRSLRPDLELRDIRGNVPTRLRKLDEGNYDAVLLACAGLDRLGLGDRATVRLDPPWLPAPGQGAIGIEGRTEDSRIGPLLSVIEDAAARAATTAERAVLARLEGGCSTPVGAFSWLDGDVLMLSAAVYAPDGSCTYSSQGSIAADSPDVAQLGWDVARELLEAGADKLLGAGQKSTRTTE